MDLINSPSLSKPTFSTLDSNDIYSITLKELIALGVFSWQNKELPGLTIELDWKDYAYSEEVYNRLCKAFVARFYWREIGIMPPGHWLQRLSYDLIYKLCPKYNPLYKELDNDNYNVLANTITFTDTLEHNRQETSTDVAEEGTSTKDTTKVVDGTKTENGTATETTTGTSTSAETELGGVTEHDENKVVTDDAGKARQINSNYPETLLANTQAYAATGTDTQDEKQTTTTGIDDKTTSSNLKTDGETKTEGESVAKTEKITVTHDESTQNEVGATTDTTHEKEKTHGRNDLKSRVLVVGDVLEKISAYADDYTSVDEMFLRELEYLFSPYMALNINLY